jgi:predicted PhzF superfamily epimerase YddE/YHI9
MHDGKIVITLPADHPLPVDTLPTLEAAIACKVTQLYRGIDDYIAVVGSIEELTSITPDLSAIADLDSRGLIVTCRDGKTAIACRCFYPALGVDEDPVTGSAHTALIPLWTSILNTNVFTSRQLSARGGKVDCVYKGDTVALLGHAFTYLEGVISV